MKQQRIATAEEVEQVRKNFVDFHYMEILRCLGMTSRDELRPDSQIRGKACIAAFVMACCLIEALGRHLTTKKDVDAFGAVIKLMNCNGGSYNAKQLYYVGRCGLIHGLVPQHPKFEVGIAISDIPRAENTTVVLTTCTGSADSEQFDILYLQQFIIDLGVVLDTCFNSKTENFLKCVARGIDTYGRISVHQALIVDTEYTKFSKLD
jgi:hypothetical protein